MTYIMLQILRSMLKRGLAKLGSKLGSGVVQEVAILAEDVAVGAVGSSTLLCLVGIAIVLRLRLGLGRGRW